MTSNENYGCYADQRVSIAAMRYERAQIALDEWATLMPSRDHVSSAEEAVEEALYAEQEQALSDAAAASPVGLMAMATKVALWLNTYGENAEECSYALIASLARDLDAMLHGAEAQNARRAFSAAASVPSSR